jgi:hypothetical protein
MNTKKSEILERSLEINVNPLIANQLESLQWFIDPSLFLSFQERINDILKKNPGSENIIASELDKTSLAVSNSFATYKRAFQSIMTNASNDDMFHNPDENLIV